MQAYTGNRADAVESVIDATPGASAIRELMQGRESWKGRADGLLAELVPFAADSVTKGKEWPANGQALSRRLNRLKSALRPAGIEIDRERDGRARLIVIRHRPPIHEKKLRHSAPVASLRHQFPADRDGNDGNDAISRPLSGNSKEVPAEPPSQRPGESAAGEAYRRRKDGE